MCIVAFFITDGGAACVRIVTNCVENAQRPVLAPLVRGAGKCAAFV